MKESEARELLMIIHAAVGGRQSTDLSSDEFWIEALLRYDAEIATDAVLRGIDEWRWFPSWAEFREAYKAQQRLREPDGEQRAPLPGKFELAFWVRRWTAARYLYERFGRDQDLRPFREQYPSAASPPPDVPQEWMPEEEWVKEAERVKERDVWRAIGGGHAGRDTARSGAHPAESGDHR